MSVIVSPPARRWTRVHRAALAIVVLSLAFAAVLGLLIARLVTDSASPTVPSTSVPGHLPPTDQGCQMNRPGQPC